MTNDFLDAVTIALHKKFGDGYEYYTENIEQDLVRPCFTVQPLNQLKKAKSPTRYYRTLPLVIHYFTDKDVASNAKRDSYAMGERILEALEYLPVGDHLFRGENMEYKLVENVLQVFVTYNFFTFVTVESDLMEENNYNIVPTN